MHYKWQDNSSLIHDVEFFAPNKAEEALIYAPEGATKELLQRIPEALRAQGFTATPDMAKGEFVLRVQGFESHSQLLNVLQQTGFTRGAAQAHSTEYDHKDPKTVKQTVHENLMRISGLVYLLGDGLLMGAGWKRGDMAELATGAIWGSTGVVLTAYGKKDADVQTQQLYQKLNEHLKQEGFDFSQDNSLSIERLGGKNGLVNKLQKFLYDHPVEFNNTLQGVGGTMMIKAGMNQKNAFKTAAGVSVATGQWGGMLVDAEPLQAGEEKPSFPSWRWFKEQPLRITGAGASLNNFLNLAGIYFVDKKKNAERSEGGAVRNAYHSLLEKAQNSNLNVEEAEKFTALRAEIDAHEGIKRDPITGAEHQMKMGGKDAYKANTAAAACYLAANFLYGMCDKNAAPDLKKIGKLDEVYAAAAQIIGSQDAQIQPELVQRIAGFMAGQADIKETPQEIADLIQDKVRNLANNPWAAPTQPSKSVTHAVHQKTAALGMPIQGSLAVH